MIRSFPRTRESRAKYAGPSMASWVPAFAGTSGFDFRRIAERHAAVSDTKRQKETPRAQSGAQTRAHANKTGPSRAQAGAPKFSRALRCARAAARGPDRAPWRTRREGARQPGACARAQAAQRDIPRRLAGAARRDSRSRGLADHFARSFHHGGLTAGTAHSPQDEWDNVSYATNCCTRRCAPRTLDEPKFTSILASNFR